MTSALHASNALNGLSVFERGWLSSNNILIHAAPGESGAVLVDTGHVHHAAQTLALVKNALAGRPLARIVNTHLHSDHCGGNASLQREFKVPVAVPPGHAAAVQSWDEDALTYRASGQHIERFSAEEIMQPGSTWRAGGRDWQALAAPGHDEHSLVYFDTTHGVLISADALWENGFGAVFPEMLGEPGFDAVGATLDLIEGLHAQVVVPGHGRPFTDVAAALTRARQRLNSFQAEPAKHARHAGKVLIKYHLMEVREQSLAELRQWAQNTPFLVAVWQQHMATTVASPAEWAARTAAELVAQGVLAQRGDWLLDL
jgi:glyoxylase-like metal-dependent hydrolase (beta-lactamase superfamily II)